MRGQTEFQVNLELGLTPCPSPCPSCPFAEEPRRHGSCSLFRSSEEPPCRTYHFRPWLSDVSQLGWLPLGSFPPGCGTRRCRRTEARKDAGKLAPSPGSPTSRSPPSRYGQDQDGSQARLHQVQGLCAETERAKQWLSTIITNCWWISPRSRDRKPGVSDAIQCLAVPLHASRRKRGSSSSSGQKVSCLARGRSTTDRTVVRNMILNMTDPTPQGISGQPHRTIVLSLHILKRSGGDPIPSRAM